jgi:hypothetical protein
MTCDNIHSCHDLDTITETKEAIKEGCNVCGEVVIIKKDAKGNPERRQYAEAHRKEILQPGENLYYLYHHAQLRTTG